jgi:YVTN family beta-propeller protein
VVPIATATNAAGEPIEVSGGPGSGRGPGLIAVTPDGKTAYVVIVGHPGAVVPIATATNTPGPPIEIGNHPDGIAITPDGKTVYVANINSGTVTPIATATNTAGEPIEVGVRPRAIAVTPDGKTAYVVNQSRPQPSPWPSYPPDERGTVTPIDTATNTPGEPIDVGNEPFAIAVTPDGKTVYVANTWENTGRLASGQSTVTPIATATNTPGPPIEVGQGPRAIAITADGRTAYVASWQGGTVTPIETATNTAGTPIEVGEGARAIVITADGETAYVGVWGEPGTVVPIATATNTAGTPIEVGDGPYAIAITPGARRL